VVAVGVGAERGEVGGRIGPVASDEAPDAGGDVVSDRGERFEVGAVDAHERVVNALLVVGAREGVTGSLESALQTFDDVPDWESFGAPGLPVTDRVRAGQRVVAGLL